MQTPNPLHAGTLNHYGHGILPAVIREAQIAGHRTFSAPDSVNLIAIRRPAAEVGSPDNEFRCRYTCSWFDAVRRSWCSVWWPCTTIPGTAPLVSPMNGKGTAILVPNQYIGMHEIGYHKGRPALVQVGPCTVDRDDDRDDRAELDGRIIDTGLFGINTHDGRSRNWSSGCQVLPGSGEADGPPGEAMSELLQLVRQSTTRYGKRVSYTLLTCEQAPRAWAECGGGK